MSTDTTYAVLLTVDHVTGALDDGFGPGRVMPPGAYPIVEVVDADPSVGLREASMTVMDRDGVYVTIDPDRNHVVAMGGGVYLASQAVAVALEDGAYDGRR